MIRRRVKVPSGELLREFSGFALMRISQLAETTTYRGSMRGLKLPGEKHHPSTQRYLNMQIEPSPGVSQCVAELSPNALDDPDRERLKDELRASERRLREVIEALPAAVYTTDAEGRITSFNQAAVRFAGRVPELGTDSWCVSWKLFRPDGTPLPHDQCPMAIALKEGREIRGQDAVAERPDGTRVHFIAYPTPLRDALGKVVGAVNMLVDITARTQAEDALRNLHADLRRHTEELTRFNQAAVGRELRMIGLKKEVNELCGRLGELPRYSLEFEKDATVTAS